MAKYRIVHNTKYAFSTAIAHCTGRAYLTPRDTQSQHLKFHQLVFTPLARNRVTNDAFGNRQSDFDITQPLQTLNVTAISTVETKTPYIGDFARSPTVANYNQMSSEALATFREPTYLTPKDKLISDYARQYVGDDQSVLNSAKSLMRGIHQDFQYDTQTTNTETCALTALELRRGVCQDYTHVAIASLRARGIAARYVSGYLSPRHNQSRRGSINAMSHAWFSVFCPQNGWVDLDPTNNCQADERYITVAWGRDYADVAPVTGSVSGGGHLHMNVAVDVHRLD